jgi:hypothetical protein
MTVEETTYSDPFNDPQLFELDPVGEHILEVRKKESRAELASVVGRFPLKDEDAAFLAGKVEAGQGVAVTGTFALDISGVQRLGGVVTLISYARDVELG